MYFLESPLTRVFLQCHGNFAKTVGRSYMSCLTSINLLFIVDGVRACEHDRRSPRLRPAAQECHSATAKPDNSREYVDLFSAAVLQVMLMCFYPPALQSESNFVVRMVASSKEEVNNAMWVDVP